MPTLQTGPLLVLSLLLLLTAASEPTTTSTPPTTTEPQTPSPPPEQPPLPPPPPQRKSAEVLVIDMTKNTSSIVSIPAVNAGNNLTLAEQQHIRAVGSLRCLAQHRANIFLVMHLNRNWRQKLALARQLLRYAYEQSSTNVAIVLFNEFTNILATFGTDALNSEAELLLGLARIQATMKRDESAAVVEHWASFRLDDALKAGFRYAKLFLRQFSLDARPSVLVSYFDDGAGVSDSTVEETAQVLRHFQPTSPFVASVSLLQWPQDLPVPPQVARVTELLSSSPGYQVTGPSVDSLLTSSAQLVAEICRTLQPV